MIFNYGGKEDHRDVMETEATIQIQLAKVRKLVNDEDIYI